MEYLENLHINGIYVKDFWYFETSDGFFIANYTNIPPFILREEIDMSVMQGLITCVPFNYKNKQLTVKFN